MYIVTRLYLTITMSLNPQAPVQSVTSTPKNNQRSLIAKALRNFHYEKYGDVLNNYRKGSYTIKFGLSNILRVKKNRGSKVVKKKSKRKSVKKNKDADEDADADAAADADADADTNVPVDTSSLPAAKQAGGSSSPPTVTLPSSAEATTIS